MKVKLTNVGERPELWLYDDIGGFFGGITANDVRLALSDVKGSAPIEVHINSGGGDYFEGITIHSMLSRRAGTVNVTVDGLAASAASLIAMAGDSIEMAAGAQMMIHEVRAGFYGTSGEFRQMAATMDASNSDIVKLYSSRWTGTEEELRNALAEETWMTADEAITAGLADTTAERLAIAASSDLSRFNYRHAPVSITGPHAELLRRLDSLTTELEESKHE